MSHFEPFAASQPRSIMALANGDHVLFEQISKDQWTTTRLPADLLELLFRHMQTTGMVSPWVPYLPGASTFETTVQHKADGTSKKKLTRPGLFTHAGLVFAVNTQHIFDVASSKSVGNDRIPKLSPSAKSKTPSWINEAMSQ